MRNRRFAGRLVLSIVVLIVAIIWAKQEISIDSCLDRGGRWNYEVDVCEGSLN